MVPSVKFGGTVIITSSVPNNPLAITAKLSICLDTSIRFIIDLLYGGGGIFGYHFSYFFTTTIFVFYLSSFKLKTMLILSF